MDLWTWTSVTGFLTSSTSCSIRRVLSSDCGETRDTVSSTCSFLERHRNQTITCRLFAVYWNATKGKRINRREREKRSMSDVYRRKLATMGPSVAELAGDFWFIRLCSSQNNRTSVMKPPPVCPLHTAGCLLLACVAMDAQPHASDLSPGSVWLPLCDVSLVIQWHSSGELHPLQPWAAVGAGYHVNDLPRPSPSSIFFLFCILYLKRASQRCLTLNRVSCRPQMPRQCNRGRKKVGF